MMVSHTWHRIRKPVKWHGNRRNKNHLKRYKAELFQRLNAHEDPETVARRIAKRANADPEQVLAFGFALGRELKEKKGLSNFLDNPFAYPFLAYFSRKLWVLTNRFAR